MATSTRDQIIKLTGGRQIIDLAGRYGVVGDGITDNSPALMKLQSDVSGVGKPHYVLLMPPGEVRYANNKWLYNVQSFELIGAAEKTTLRSTNNSAWGHTWAPLNTGGMFQTAVMTSDVPSILEGHRFNSLAAGSNTLTLTIIADHSNYTVGQRILLLGYDQQLYGFPPNGRFFEWHIITGINTTTGVITLKDRLKYSYNSLWKDLANHPGMGVNFGKPRIYLMDRNNYSRPKYIKFRNIVFANGTKGTGYPVAETAHQAISAENVYYEKCKFEANIWPSENEKVIYDQCDINSCDLDKLVEFCEIKDCKVQGVCGGATGITYLTLLRNYFSALVNVAPRHVYAEGNHFNAISASPSFYLQPEQTHVYSVSVKNNTFSGGSGGGGHIGFGASSSYAIGASGNNILITDNGSAANDNIPAICAPGAMAFRTDGAKSGEIIDVTHDGTNWVISGTWDAPTAGEVWHFETTSIINDLGGNRVIDMGQPLFSEAALRFSGNAFSTKGLRKTYITEKDLLNAGSGLLSNELNGRIMSLSIDVRKIYTGSNSNAFLIIWLDNDYPEQIAANMLQTGIRTVNASGETGAQPGDALEGIVGFGTFRKLLKIKTQSSNNAFAAWTVTNPQDLPRFVLTIEWHPY